MSSRIACLPWRDWSTTSIDVAKELTELLRQPHGTQQLRGVQGASLFELWQHNGLFAHIRTGGGKTLITGLGPVVVNAKRPLLILPAKLIGKTIAEFDQYRLHWKIPHNIRIVSYEKLGREGHADLLNAYCPDAIFADEAHKLKHIQKAACAIRVARFISENPRTIFCALSATLTKGSIKDYWHLLIWALRSGAPVPLDQMTLESWCAALDAIPQDRYSLAELVPSLGSINTREEAMVAYQRRLCATPGVIVSKSSFREVPLTLKITQLAPPPEVEEHLTTLRDLWRAPDGWDFGDAKFQVWSAARQLAQGFCYVHDPRPPMDWFLARRVWCSFARRVIESGVQLDSELQVFNACASGLIATEEWSEWVKVKDTFKPKSATLWFGTSVLDYAIDWGKRHPKGSLIWVDHRAVGFALEALTGWKFYHREGCTTKGEYIERARNDEPAILSVKSNLEGRNLQRFRNNLIMSPRPEGYVNEQLISRTHRDGQKEPVYVEMLVVVHENQTSVENAIREAEYAYLSTEQEQKLLIAERI